MSIYEGYIFVCKLSGVESTNVFIRELIVLNFLDSFHEEEEYTFSCQSACSVKFFWVSEASFNLVKIKIASLSKLLLVHRCGNYTLHTEYTRTNICLTFIVAFCCLLVFYIKNVLFTSGPKKNLYRYCNLFLEKQKPNTFLIVVFNC